MGTLYVANARTSRHFEKNACALTAGWSVLTCVLTVDRFDHVRCVLTLRSSGERKPGASPCSPDPATVPDALLRRCAGEPTLGRLKRTSPTFGLGKLAGQFLAMADLDFAPLEPGHTSRRRSLDDPRALTEQTRPQLLPADTRASRPARNRRTGLRRPRRPGPVPGLEETLYLRGDVPFCTCRNFPLVAHRSFAASAADLGVTKPVAQATTSSSIECSKR